MRYMFLWYMFLCLLECSAKDAITFNSVISDKEGDTLVSSGEKFELGFFTPNGSIDGRRYVGIWYYRLQPQTVAWIANRESPVMNRRGIFGITEDGNLEVWDVSGKSYWSTSLETSSPASKIAKLMDNGNLIMGEGKQENVVARNLWQSFDNPTDTFLPGMKMDENMTLTSWKSYDDPSPGNFTFQLDQDEEHQFIIWRRSMRYWKSGVSGKFIGSDEMPYAISYFLSNFTATLTAQNASVPPLKVSLFGDTRLIVSYSGQAQYLQLDSEKIWAQIWAEPRDRCSVYNACGNYGSCNSENKLMCKCLPGFEPNFPEKWRRGDSSDGCTRESTICGKGGTGDMFLTLSIVEVGSPDSQFDARGETECKLECLNNCQCQAYSYQEANAKRGYANSRAACWIWLEDLNNLQEGYIGGRNISVRVASSGIGLTGRSCGTCGTNVIPYPLSTGMECGDTSYLNFNCNMSSGQVSFKVPGNNYTITSINPEARKFFIQTKGADTCFSRGVMERILGLKQSSPFHATGQCNTYSVTGGTEVEMRWDPPLEPTCSSSADCKDWPNSSCNATSDGKKRCLCNPSFQWDGMILNCTQGRHGKGQWRAKMPVSLIIAVAFTSLAVILVLLSTTSYFYLYRKRVYKELGNLGSIQRALNWYDSERHVKDLIESGRFKKDDTDSIDVPSFDLEAILAATNNLSSSNKLGQGGFGPVYKGKFHGGQEIAVKRLSSCSGQGMEEFKNEVVLIAKLQHRNLVRLLGYCVVGDEKMLLYEYMPNRSLDSFIFDRQLCTSLDWEKRYNIIFGIARGLLYLHQDSRLRIIHRDLKTSNILLDGEMNPKISDFGLARIFGGKETAANTNRVVGTYGYMSPEYALDGLFSFKSDVFSFGVVVIEIISGKRNTGFYQPEQSLSLLGYAWHLWKKEKGLDLLDLTLRQTCKADEFLKCLCVGLLCVQEDPGDRPTMSNVVFMLGSETATLPSPKQPAFVVRRCPSSVASSSSKPETCSQNELTVTLEDGR